MTAMQEVEYAINVIKGVESSGLTKDAARELVGKLGALHSYVEDTLAEVAVEHQLYISLGDYGTGRHVALADIEYRWGQSFKAGDWVPSSATC